MGLHAIETARWATSKKSTWRPRFKTERETNLPKFDPNAKPVEVKQPDLPLDINLPNLPETPGK